MKDEEEEDKHRPSRRTQSSSFKKKKKKKRRRYDTSEEEEEDRNESLSDSNSEDERERRRERRRRRKEMKLYTKAKAYLKQHELREDSRRKTEDRNDVSVETRPILNENDYFKRAREFRAWLRTKRRNVDEMETKELRERFDAFVKKWNRGELDERIYRGGAELTPLRTTSHRWAFAEKLSDTERMKLASMRDRIGVQTHSDRKAVRLLPQLKRNPMNVSSTRCPPAAPSTSAVREKEDAKMTEFMRRNGLGDATASESRRRRFEIQARAPST